MDEFKILRIYYPSYETQCKPITINIDVRGVKDVLKTVLALQREDVGSGRGVGYLLLTHTPCMKTVKLEMRQHDGTLMPYDMQKIYDHVSACCACYENRNMRVNK